MKTKRILEVDIESILERFLEEYKMQTCTGEIESIYAIIKDDFSYVIEDIVFYIMEITNE